MDQYDSRLDGEYQGTKHMAQKYAGGRTKAKVSKGMENDVSELPMKSMVKNISQVQGSDPAFDYPDTVDSINSKSKTNSSRLNKQSLKEWYVT